MHFSILILAIAFIEVAHCLSKSELERRVLARGWRFAPTLHRLDAPEADAPVRRGPALHAAHLQWEHDEIDSRAVSENVDLEKVDDGAFERLRRALHSMHPRVGVRLWKREASAWGVDQ